MRSGITAKHARQVSSHFSGNPPFRKTAIHDALRFNEKNRLKKPEKQCPGCRQLFFGWPVDAELHYTLCTGDECHHHAGRFSNRHPLPGDDITQMIAPTLAERARQPQALHLAGAFLHSLVCGCPFA